MRHLPGGSRFVDERLPFILARRLISRVGMPWCAYPSFPLRTGKNTLHFCYTSFEKLLEVLGFLC